MLADIHFLRPEWLLAVPAVIAAAVLLARRQLGPGSWQRVIDPALAPYVLSGSATKRGDYRWIILALTGVIAAVALAGPAWQRVEQPVYRSEQALVVALDLSRSMDAQDVSPSRMLRARLKILDLLDKRGSGETALVVYSANAFTVTPLTTDNDTIAALANSLSTDIMPSRGSYPVAAINKGRALLEQANAAYGEVLLITDGGSSPAALEAAEELRDVGYTLSILGVGTPEGAPIPRAGGGFVTDQAGRIAVPKLEERGLRDLASAGGGRFARMTADTRDLDALLTGEIGGRRASDESLAADQWREEGPWLVLLLLPIAAMAFRRGWVLIVAIAIIPLAQPVEASVWDDLWLTRDQQAQRALENGDAELASGLFEDGEWRAVSRYRAGDFPGSASEFAERGDTRNLYNLGNALALQGEFESAIDAYEEVLEIEPDNNDAAYNRDLLQQVVEQQQQQEQEGDQQQQSESSDGEGEQDPNAEQQEGENAQSDGEQQEGDPSQRDESEMSEEDMQALQEELQRAAEEAQQNAEESEQQLSEEELEELRRAQEQQQAMEQWLRRIPNDPGGLLRRKFLYQYQRSDTDQDGNNLWPDNEVQPW